MIAPSSDTPFLTLDVRTRFDAVVIAQAVRLYCTTHIENLQRAIDGQHTDDTEALIGHFGDDQVLTQQRNAYRDTLDYYAMFDTGVIARAIRSADSGVVPNAIPPAPPPSTDALRS